VKFQLRAASLPVFEVLGFKPFALSCVAGARAMSPVTRVGLAARASRVTEQKLVVVNIEAELDPAERNWLQVEAWAKSLSGDDLAVLETREVYRLARAVVGVQTQAFWADLMYALERRNDALTPGSVQIHPQLRPRRRA
jgi:hypothetical protein